MEKRNKGTGCIYFREDKDQYEGRIIIGSKYNGKPIFKYVTGKRKTDVQRQLTNIRAQLDNGTYFEPSKITLGSWLNEWMETFMKMSVKVQTFNTYEVLINKTIVPLIGGVKLKDLAPIIMQKVFNELTKSYQPSSLRKIKSILVMALRKAKENDLIIKDPMIGVKLPKIPKTEIESMTVSDIDKFLDVAKNHNIYQAVVTGLGTGKPTYRLKTDNTSRYDLTLYEFNSR